MQLTKLKYLINKKEIADDSLMFASPLRDILFAYKLPGLHVLA